MGNMTSRAGVTYVWDPLGNLLEVKDASRWWGYFYTADDEKLWSYNLLENKQYFTVRDLDGTVLREIVNNTSAGYDNYYWQEDWVWREGTLLATHTPSWGLLYVTTDHLGSPRLFTDSAGYSRATQQFYPFGEEVTTFGSEPSRFTGHERNTRYDAWPMMDYMHARWYSPELGRFISADPIGMAGSPGNLYSYVGNDPGNYIDPTGLKSAFHILSGSDADLCWTIICADVVGEEPRIGGQTFAEWFTQARLEFLLFKAGRERRMASLSQGESGLVAFAAVTVQANAAYWDALIPFSDPFAVSGIYDPDDMRFLAPRLVAETALGVATGAASGPKGMLFGRARYRNGAAGAFNRGKVRFGWSWDEGRNRFGLHGGQPGT
ncbi:MAG: RHS repeat-associated core domain-containing protein, partial [Candidatus Binatia bacterium]